MDKIDCVVFDFDDTLYDYENLNKNCLEQVFKDISRVFDIDYERIISNYKIVKKECEVVTLNHNKLVYFIKLFKNLSLSLHLAVRYHKDYEELFYSSIVLFDKCLDFIQYLYLDKIKIIVLTNNTIENTINKLEKLNIIQFIHSVVTSDIVGFEKPDPNIYSFLFKLLESYNIQCPVFIGDNYKNDIKPFVDRGFRAFLKTDDILDESHTDKFSNYESLLSRFKIDFNI